MRVMVMVKATPGSEAGVMPSEELMREMGRFNEELVAAKIMKAGEGLKPTSEAVRVHFSGTKRTVINGPFAETKELVAGYWLWEVKSMEEAIDWVKKCPNPMMEDSDIEIRPLFEMADFAEVDPTGTFAREEEQLRNTLSTQKAEVRPYLFFSGRCEEALAFYKQALGAQVGMVLRFNESPDPIPEGMLKPGFEKKIMHAEFTVGDMTIMASDGCGEEEAFGGFSLTLTVPTPEAADRVFNALADGGKVNMPLGPTFWSPRFGQVSDKFGVGWMVMVPMAEK
ncbi:MAG: VOC family protein [Candidatus Sumerlaeia bacterium]|nr:VOC family protein [Candidatus Sumerlaeia bacterium]